MEEKYLIVREDHATKNAEILAYCDSMNDAKQALEEFALEKLKEVLKIPKDQLFQSPLYDTVPVENLSCGTIIRFVNEKHESINLITVERLYAMYIKSYKNITILSTFSIKVAKKWSNTKTIIDNKSRKLEPQESETDESSNEESEEEEEQQE